MCPLVVECLGKVMGIGLVFRDNKIDVKRVSMAASDGDV